MMNLESPLSTISRNCKSDLIAIGGKSCMKVLKLGENNELKVVKILKVARTSNKTGTTDLAWNNYLENILASTTLLGSNVLIWDINQINLNKLNEKIGSHTQLINRVNWNYKNVNLLASCSQDGLLNIWNITNKPDEYVISMQHKEKIRDCQFSPFSEYLILASYVSGAVKLWDTRNYKSHVKEFIHHETDVLSIDWHPELENVFCSGSMDKNLCIWDCNQNSPIQSYKTSHGTSRVKWWKKNPQYIISSYQTNNFYASMWNINIDNMPEYLYKGHKDVVTGFCWDLSETKLITCSKDNWIIVNNFADGYRCMDNVCTHFSKFGDEEKIYSYSDTKPKKTNLFENVDYSRLIKKTKGVSLYHSPHSNSISSSHSHSNLSNLYDKNYSDKNYSEKNLIDRNFSDKNFSERNSILGGVISSPFSHIRKKRFQIKINNTNLINFSNSKTLLLNQYYTFNKKQIEELFENYSFLTNDSFLANNIVNLEFKNLPKSTKLNFIIINNWKYAKDKLKNYNHLAVWSQLKFLSELESFGFIDNCIVSGNRKFSTLTRTASELSLSPNAQSLKEKKISNIQTESCGYSDCLMIEILRNNVIELINFLIDGHADIWLATIIIYIFHDVFSFNKDKYLRIVTECFENLRRLKLHKIAAKLMKFAIFDEMKHNKQNTLILLSCKKCGMAYDPSIYPGLCPSCNSKVRCQIW
jgi:hypothetical protein